MSADFLIDYCVSTQTQTHINEQTSDQLIGPYLTLISETSGERNVSKSTFAILCLRHLLCPVPCALLCSWGSPLGAGYIISSLYFRLVWTIGILFLYVIT